MTEPLPAGMHKRRPRRLSFSAVEQFYNCERQFYYARVLGLQPEPVTPITEIGSAYHTAIAAALDTPTERDWSVWDERAVTKAIATHREKLEKYRVDVPGLQAEMLANLTRLRSQVLALAGIQTHATVAVASYRARWIERWFDEPDLGYRGVIDLCTTVAPIVDGTGRVIGTTPEQCVWDWKVVTSHRRRSLRDAQYSAQLALYAYTTGSQNACFVEIPRNTDRPIRVIKARFSEDEMRHWAAWLSQARSAILMRRQQELAYRRTDRKNPLCHPIWCPFYDRCYPGAPPPPPEETTAND